MNNITCSCPEVIVEAEIKGIREIDNLEELVNLLLIRANRAWEKMLEELVIENRGNIYKRVNEYEELDVEIKEAAQKAKKNFIKFKDTLIAE
ncbi:hypothetical protein KI387_001037, partial [Taxus chinensis]